MGDGQTFALRLQASRTFKVYSLNFSEPWMGGKKPIRFNVSLSRTQQYSFDFVARDVDKDRQFSITGISLGLAKRLQWPDDYFSVSHALGYQQYDFQNYNIGLFNFGNGTSNSLTYTFGLSRKSSGPNPIFPTGGSSFEFLAKFTPPFSLLGSKDFKSIKEESDEIIGLRSVGEASASQLRRLETLEESRFKWLEFYKIKFKGEWYTKLAGKLILKPTFEFGFLGAYNNDRGVIPFERFFLGGDGLGTYSLDGREAIALRGYPNQSLSSQDGGSIYNKFSLELRHPITLAQQTKIYALAFLEGGASYNNFDDFDPFTIQRSAGVGLRLFMPAFGLLGIDFGHGFDPLPGDINKSGWQTHFIIGQQF